MYRLARTSTQQPTQVAVFGQYPPATFFVPDQQLVQEGVPRQQTLVTFAHQHINTGAGNGLMKLLQQGQT